MKVAALRSDLRFLFITVGIVILDIRALLRENYFGLLLGFGLSFPLKYYELVGCDPEKPEIDVKAKQFHQ